MANLRVFVSSTAYDLGVLRSSLRGFIEGLGYDAVLSEYSDVLYDPREHAHKSCLAEVSTCDMVVLVIGSRFGSPLRDEVLKSSLHDLHPMHLYEDAPEQHLSVTQAEALAAAAKGIPVFAFVEAGVYHDYSVYQRNKGKSFAAEIAYPSISQPDTAEYIFNFIDYLQSRSFNNAVITFDRMEDVVTHLQKQWASLFQRMLAEARTGRDDSMRIDRLADQFEDLKAALLATVGDAPGREVARAVIRSRRLVDFLRALPNPGIPLREAFVNADSSFDDLLRDVAGVVGIEESRGNNENHRGTLLRTEDGRDLICRLSPLGMQKLEREWQDIRVMQPANRAAIYEALMDTEDRMPMSLVQRARSEAEEKPGPSNDELLESLRLSVPRPSIQDAPAGQQVAVLQDEHAAPESAAGPDEAPNAVTPS